MDGRAPGSAGFVGNGSVYYAYAPLAPRGAWTGDRHRCRSKHPVIIAVSFVNAH